MSEGLSTEDKQTLLRLARAAMEAAVRGEQAPRPASAGFSPAVKVPGGCFVTLSLNAKLRGCIGGLNAEVPLFEEVMRRAAQAALRDYRFPPVGAAELDSIEVEVSLTTRITLAYRTPEELAARLRPGIDGVVLRQGDRRATFLPQVWDNAPEPEKFLALLCEKLGLKPDAWRTTRLEAATYQVTKFTEPEVGADPV